MHFADTANHEPLRSVERVRLRSRRAGLALVATALLLAAGATEAGAAAAQSVRATFHSPIDLTESRGAAPSAVLTTSAGDFYVVSSNGAADGCTVFRLARDGSSRLYLGRTPGGLACVATGTSDSSVPALAAVSQDHAAAETGASTDGGSTFHWTMSAPVGTPLGLAADPQPSAGAAQLFLLSRNVQDSSPDISVSADGGAHYVPDGSVLSDVDIPRSERSAQAPPLAGNLVAHRDTAGLHLFTVLVTSDQAAGGYSHIYEAVGDVRPPNPPGGVPVISWRDLPEFTMPAGRVVTGMAVTAVDVSGGAFIAFADSTHLYVAKASTRTRGVRLPAHPIAVDTVANGMPTGADGAYAPAIAAGGVGMVDVAWYASGTGAYVAQTLDGGATWDAELAGRLSRTGPPAAALQLAIDPVSGAAALAYTGDQDSDGDADVHVTRQCEGRSAVSGAELTDDCKEHHSEESVLPGTTCPGPQVRDEAFDAVHDGHNIPQLDLFTASFVTSSGASEAARITVNRLASQLPDDVRGAEWRVIWSQQQTTYYAEAALTAKKTWVFTAGHLKDDGTPATVVSTTGETSVVAPGSRTGMITINIPLTAVGAALPGTVWTHIAAYATADFDEDEGGWRVVDRAPDGGFGADYVVAQVCPPDAAIPEVSFTSVIPGLGAAAAMMVALEARRRRRRHRDA